MNFMTKHELIECPACSQMFECKQGSITICQCSNIQLSREQLAYIAERWEGCLCLSCLEDIKQQWSNEELSLGSIEDSAG